MNEGNMNNGVPTPVNPQNSIPPVQPANTIPVAPVQPVQTVQQVSEDIPVADPLNSGLPPYNPLNNDAVNFVASGESMEKKKGKGGLIAIIFIVLLILGVGGFLLFKFVLMPMLIQPKQVFEIAVDSFSKEINNNVSTKLHDKVIYSINLDIDSNMEPFKSYSGYKYNLKFGNDVENNLLEIGYGVKDEYDVEHSFYSYVKDGKTYERYSNYQSLIYTGAFGENSELYNLFNALSSSHVNSEDATYLVNKVSNEIIINLDENKFTKEQATVVVKGESLKANKNTYSMNSDDLYAIGKNIAKSIVADNKALEIFASINGIDKELQKEKLNIFIEKDFSLKNGESSTIDISIYTLYSDASFIGLEVVTKENTYMDDDTELTDSYTKVQYSTYNGNFNVFIYNKSNALKYENSFTIVGENKVDYTSILFKDEDYTYARLKYKELSNGYNIEYTLFQPLTGSQQDITGSLNYTVKTGENKETSTYSFELRGGSEFIKINATIDQDWGYDVANINTGAAVGLTESERQNVIITFENDLKTNTPGEFIIDIYKDIIKSGSVAKYIEQ